MAEASSGVACIDRARHDLVLFDLDGVITPTADLHRAAWAELFVDHGFTDRDYLSFIDGRSRYDGVRSFLNSRAVTLPEGHPDDAPGDRTVCALGNRKDAVFRERLERDGVAPYADATDLIDRLDASGVTSAVVSSSRNARPVLAAAELLDRFVVIVDGVVIESEGIPGKPHPDPFLLATRLARSDPAKTIVIEDAESGVTAGAAGGFDLVIGVDRVGARAALLAAGAGVVVDTLNEISVTGALT